MTRTFPASPRMIWKPSRQAACRNCANPSSATRTLRRDLLEDMARTESNTRLLQMLVESGRLSQNTIDLCCWNQTDSRLAASMLPKASDHLLVRLSGRDWWPSRKNAVESGRLDRARLSEMIEKENHPDVVSALIGTGEFDMDGEAKAIRRVITSRRTPIRWAAGTISTGPAGRSSDRQREQCWNTRP